MFNKEFGNIYFAIIICIRTLWEPLTLAIIIIYRVGKTKYNYELPKI